MATEQAKKVREPVTLETKVNKLTRAVSAQSREIRDLKSCINTQMEINKTLMDAVQELLAQVRRPAVDLSMLALMNDGDHIDLTKEESELGDVVFEDEVIL